MHPNLHVTAEAVSNNTINYPNIYIHGPEDDLQISIFRKSNFTDTVILYTTKHAAQHKYAAIRYLHNKVCTYQLSNEAYNRELNTIQNILYNNFYPIYSLKTPKHMNKHITNLEPTLLRHKWSTFTYIGKEATYITKLFQNTNLKK